MNQKHVHYLDLWVNMLNVNKLLYVTPFNSAMSMNATYGKDEVSAVGQWLKCYLVAKNG